MISADPSAATARPAPGSPGSAVTATVSAPTVSAPSISVVSITNTRMQREKNPARIRRGTAATLFNVWWAENTTPVPENSKPIRPAMNGMVDVGKVVIDCSTVDCRAGGTISLMRRCCSSGFAASTRDSIAAPSSSNGKMLRKP